MITDADGQGLASCKWTRRVDDTLDKLMDADDDHLSVGPGRGLAYVIHDGVGLIGILLVVKVSVKYLYAATSGSRTD